MPENRKNIYLIVVYIAALVSFAALYYLRIYDDNRLTSWLWVFEGQRGWEIYLLLVLSFLPAFFINRINIERPLLFLVMPFVLSMMFASTPETIVDASRYFTQAKHLGLYGVGFFLKQWGARIDAWTDLPAIPFLYGLIFRFAGESRFYIQTFNAVLFSLAVFLTYKTGKDLWDEETGSGGAIFMLSMPFIFSQTPLMLVDVPSMFFFTLSIFTFNRAIKKGFFMFISAVFSIVLCIFSKYSLWPMLSILPVMLMVKRKEGAIRRGLSIFAVSAAVSGILFYLKRDLFIGQIMLLLEYQAPGLHRWSEGYISTFLYQIHPFIAVFALYSIIGALRKRDARYLIICYLPVLMLLFGIKRSRYIIPLLPLIALMGSYGVRDFINKEARKAVLSSAVTVSLVIAVFAYLPFLSGLSAANLKDAGEFIDGLNAGGAVVYALPQQSDVNPAVSVPLLDIYTKKRIFFDYKPGNYENPPDLSKSSLRFTWRYGNPEFYAEKFIDEGIVIVISGRGGGPSGDSIDKFPDYRECGKFAVPERFFTYGTLVDVYCR